MYAPNTILKNATRHAVISRLPAFSKETVLYLFFLLQSKRPLLLCCCHQCGKRHCRIIQAEVQLPCGVLCVPICLYTPPIFSHSTPHLTLRSWICESNEPARALCSTKHFYQGPPVLPHVSATITEGHTG